ncbi:MAG: glycoside hydrolase family 25 protein [Bacteroidales bacterium]|nr:glycoside hydrolase family 25 protein [Bacteroidales bacterium]
MAVKKKTKKKKKKRKSRKKKNDFQLPLWFHYVLLGLMVIVFFSIIYLFFIHPYKYRWKKCTGIKAYGVCIPKGDYLHGLDVSRHQGKINWDDLALISKEELPLDFVFIKATEGGDFKDENFQSNFNSAKKTGFIRGAYHYYIPLTPAKKQADFFIQNVPLESGDLPPVLDIEVINKKMTSGALQDSIKIWLSLIENHYQVTPILYTSYKFKSKHLSHADFDKYPYWIAHYYIDTVRYEGEWSFWQHTDVGIVPGIKELVDLNVFNGTKVQLEELLLPPSNPQTK